MLRATSDSTRENSGSRNVIASGGVEFLSVQILRRGTAKGGAEAYSCRGDDTSWQPTAAKPNMMNNMNSSESSSYYSASWVRLPIQVQEGRRVSGFIYDTDEVMPGLTAEDIKTAAQAFTAIHQSMLAQLRATTDLKLPRNE